MAPESSWYYDEAFGSLREIEIRYTSEADGADTTLDKCEGMSRIRKGKRNLVVADRKDLTASRDESITITDPPHGMVARCGAQRQQAAQEARSL
jgi:hypothetical protein